jgi:signal peptidase II
MTALCLTFIIVLVSDQALKFLLRCRLGPRVLPLGPFGSLRIVAGHLWLRRPGRDSSHAVVWRFWVAGAMPLVLLSASISLSGIFVGLLLGGSFSHAVEMSLRGAVTDYICLRFWPAFNLADLALAAGAIGTVLQLRTAILGMGW